MSRLTVVNYQFCDTAMHWHCYERWPDQAEFARGYFEMRVASEQANPYWAKVFLTDAVFVTVNPDPAVEEVAVHLAETSSAIRVPLDNWNAWIHTRAEASIDLQPVEQAALERVQSLIRNALPTRESLIKSADWEAKKAILERHKERTRQVETERLRKPSAHNKACRSLFRQGIRCLFCNTSHVQYIDKGPEAKSAFLCANCTRSFGPVDVILNHLYG